MNDQGVSKKVCIAVLCVDKIAFLGVDAENKIPYLASIVAICVVYTAARILRDLYKGAKNGTRTVQ